MGQPYEAVPSDPEEADLVRKPRALACRRPAARTAALVTILCCLGALIGVSVSRYETSKETKSRASARSASDSRVHGASDVNDASGGGVDGALSHVTYSLTPDDFMAQRAVRGYLHAEGVDTTDVEALKAYLPAYINVTLRADLVHGRLGAQAAGGYLAFNIYYGDDVSYVVLMSYNGTVHKMFPTFIVQDKMHVDALKPRDGSSLLMAGNINMTEEGSVYVWNWRTDNLTRVSGGNYGVNSHDVQWASSAALPSFWAPVHAGVQRIHATTGDVLDTLTVDGGVASDVNHAQLIQGNTKAIFSSRLTDALIKYDVETQAVDWICGGSYGEFDLYDIRGVKHAPGSKLWAGQHNAEYFGNNLYFMFDNMYDQERPSRALIVEIDEDARTAREVWEYIYAAYPGGYSPMFGDNDQLPTGNVLTAETGEHDAHVVELTRDKATAFQLSVMGYGSSHSGRRSSQVGWKMYSVERFYDAPLIYNASCVGGDLSFVTHNSFKQNDEYSGTYVLRTTQGVTPADDGGVDVTSGVVTWLPHWLATTVTGTYDAAGYDELELTVTNQYGDSATKTLTCG
ncbi:voltage-gated potassium channel [Aureococcus anophagefferens]|uniref:Voltage-gated potassium channel n=1 Tax=Aureococcus anophagefferens TaxID=44056 RepID=A0ABR1GFH6_AURAN